MFAKQTFASASLVAVVAGLTVIAHADPSPEDPREEQARPYTGRFELGAGFSSDEGFVAAARVAQSNLFGTGHALSLDMRMSALRQRFSLDYATADLGDGLRLHGELFNESRQLPGFVRNGAGGGIALSRQVTRYLRVFVGYRYEYVSTSTDDLLFARGQTQTSPLVDGAISSLRAGVVYDSLDRPDAPSTGTSIGSIYEIADRRLGSDFQFDRVHAWANHHRPIGGGLTLHVGGTLSQISGSSMLPRSERLFLDGSRDIRGFAPGALGPTDTLGTPLGGTMKLTARGELEVPLVRRIGLSAVGFVDAGAIVHETGAALGRSVGVGLLWRSPIGAIRVDVAVPLDGQGKPGLVFSLGGGW